MKNFNHTPVLLSETLKAISVQRGKKYIDATLGGGGHTKEILERGGLVLGIDQDQEAIDHANEKFKFEILNLKLKTVLGNFKDITEIANDNNFNSVSGILFDLGVSSHQFDTAKRGFSIKHNAPLDMRMDQNGEIRAKDVVNRYSGEDLTDIFMEYGEEEHAKKIAAAIIDARKNKSIESTGELTSIIEQVVKRTGMVHPATKVFQALRIEVNQELPNLKEGLQGAFTLLGSQARLVVISFHSLEDRIVKRTFDMWEKDSVGVVVTKKPITALKNELLSNPRARSAKLRVFQKS